MALLKKILTILTTWLFYYLQRIKEVIKYQIELVSFTIEKMEKWKEKKQSCLKVTIIPQRKYDVCYN